MKINYAENATAGTGNAFTIAATGKAFKILSDGLYSDKQRAILRELACNARDSHAAAGTARPWELHLPIDADEERYFEIRDFGTGLSHDDVLNVYTRYFASTKTDSNAYVGQLGLGSKSPFSYVREFQVKSRHGGVCNTYRMCYDDTDTPRVELLGTEPCTDTGLSVRFNTRNDAYRWHDKARSVLQWFSQLPVLTGAQIGLDKPVPDLTGVGWQLFRHSVSSTGNAAAIMGGVVYPIDASSLTGETTDDQLILLSMPVLIDFNIGDLDVAASREGLSYDNRTVANIKSKIDSVIADLRNSIRADIAAASCEWQARCTYARRISKSSSAYDMKRLTEGLDLMWNGVEITSSYLTIKHEDLYGADLEKKVRALYPSTKVNQILSHNVTINCDDNTVIMFNDSSKGTISKVKHWHATRNLKHNLLVFDSSDIVNCSEMAALLGGCEYTMTSSLDAVPASAKPIKVDGWTISRGYGRGTFKPVDLTGLLQTAEPKYYVEMHKWDILLPFSGTCGPQTVAQVQDLMERQGFIAKDTAIIGVRAIGAKRIDKLGKNWINLFTFAQQKLSDPAVKKQINNQAGHAVVFETVKHVISGAVQLIIDNATPEWINLLLDKESDMIKLIKGYATLQPNRIISDQDIAIINRFVPGIIEHDTSSEEIVQLATQVVEKYRMLHYARYNRWSEIRNHAAHYINQVDYAHVYTTLASQE